MPEHPTISLCMIVRNEAEGLARCLASAAAGVDEIIIVDTGSTDGTKAIAAGFTPHVYTEPWLDDFAGARNRAAERASGEWIMTLDGDDELVGAAQLRGLAAGAGPAVGAIMLRYITGIDAAGNVTQELWRERLTRRGAYTWRGRVHEALVPTGPLMPTGTLQRIQSTAAHVVHHGKHVRSEGSLVRNVRILERELAAMGELPDPRTLFYLARDLMLLGDTSRALSLFGRYLEIGTWDEELYAAWPGGLKVAPAEDGRLKVTGTFWLPANVRPDTYKVCLTAVKEGRAVERVCTELAAQMVGFPAFLMTMAHEHAALYGILAVVIAIVVGFIMGYLFKGGGGH